MLTLREFSEDRKLDNTGSALQLVQPQMVDENDLGDADRAIKRAGAEEAQLSTDLVPERLITGFVKLWGISPMEGVCAGLNI